MKNYRIETDSLGDVQVPKDVLWGAQTERSKEHFSIGKDIMPKEMIEAYAILKKACAQTNAEQKRLTKKKADLIIAVCEEIISGALDQNFPLHVWMTGSGTQFNMNVNEVIANRISQKLKKPLGSKDPVHPNDDVNMSQSSNDTFPAAMLIASALKVERHLLPALKSFKDTLNKKVKAWNKIVKLGRTHMQDAVPMTLGQEFSGYAELIASNIKMIEDALKGVLELPLGGTAIGTGINTWEGFDKIVAHKIAKITKVPFITAKNKFAHQGSHNTLVQLSGTLKVLASAVFKMVNDIRLLSSGPRAGINELLLPTNEPGSSIMPGKVNPTQCEALTMVCIQVISNDLAVTLSDASGILEMNVYKPVMIYNLLHSLTILPDAMQSFEKYCLKGIEPNLSRIDSHVRKSLMLVTALSPEIGYDKASHLAHFAFENDLELKQAAMQLGYLSAERFDELIDPLSMCHPLKKKRK